jgi:hypothetical protein
MPAAGASLPLLGTKVPFIVLIDPRAEYVGAIKKKSIMTKIVLAAARGGGPTYGGSVGN